MKQFQVPQFIDVEDKILGPVTMRQFFTMLIPLVIGGVLYFILDLWLTIIVLIPTTAITAIFAFYKPNGMKFSRFFASFLSYTFKPRLYVWKQEERIKSLESLEIKQKDDNLDKTQGLKNKKGYLETGSKVKTQDQSSEKTADNYIDEILNQ
jgi:hypothetical protein